MVVRGADACAAHLVVVVVVARETEAKAVEVEQAALPIERPCHAQSLPSGQHDRNVSARARGRQPGVGATTEFEIQP